MSAIQPETTANDLIERINRMQESSAHYTSRDDFEFRQLLRDCDKLIRADPYSGYLVRGTSHLLTADLKQIKEDIGKARLLSGNADANTQCDFALSQSLAKIGHFSEALPLFLSSADPESSYFGVRSKLGLGVGAINALSEMFTRASEMDLDHKSSVDQQEVDGMAAVLRHSGISDSDLTAVMDIAGGITREHNLRIKHQSVRTIDLDGEKVLHICLMLDCPAPKAAEMVFEMADRVSDLNEVPSSVHVSFASV